MAVNRNTFIAVPNDVTNPTELHRFLSRLIEKLDVAFGERSNTPFVTANTLTSVTNELTSIIGTTAEGLSSDISAFTTTANTSLSSLAASITVLESDVTVLEANLNKPAISDSSLPILTFSATYTKTEVEDLAAQVQTLQATVNTILSRLRDANILDT